MRSADPPQMPGALVFFAVKEEARFFHPPPGVTVIVTGMGRTNSRESTAKALENTRPALVLTCGFAGGLDPSLKLGEVVFDADDIFPLGNTLASAGAKAARFHCADRVAVTAAEKSRLRQATGADAVEMESAVIRELCRAQSVSSATVRVISDIANEDMPLDFNAIMTPDFRLNGTKLAFRLLRFPGLAWKLMHFQKQTAAAARQLGRLLERVLSTS